MNHFSIRIAKQLYTWDSPQIMGIVNVTPDSFAVHCPSITEADVLASIATQVQQGAAILDIGGYSTRPGAEDITPDEEWRRLSLAMHLIRQHYPNMPVSVDTFRSEIAERVIDTFGDIIVNDVAGGDWDDKMFGLIARKRVPYILTHNGWKDMSQAPAKRTYDDIVAEVLHFFQDRTSALHQMGVADIILDPGFGLGKNVEENYRLLRNMEVFQTLGHPVLAGLSRKSMLFKPLAITPQDALNATTVANTLALLHGADILRVHDVREAQQTIRIYQLTQQED